MEECFMFKGKIGKYSYSVYLEQEMAGKSHLEIDIGEGSCNELENKGAFTIKIPIPEIKDYIEMVIIKKLYGRK